MKYLIAILILFPTLVKAQVFPVGSWKRSSYIWSGEYFPLGYDSLNHQVYTYPSTGGQPQLLSGQPAYTQTAVGGPHGSGATDTLGNVYFYNQTGLASGTGSMVREVTDSAGVTIPPVASILLTGTSAEPYWAAGIVTTKATGGRVGLAGSLQGGLRGNGTSGSSAQGTFVWVTMPNNDTITKITGLYGIFALNTKGQVLSWGDGNYNYGLLQPSPVNNAPGYVPLPTGWTAYDITSNGVGTWILCDSGNHVYHKIFSGGWQYDPAYQGRGSSGAGFTSPQDVTNNVWVHLMTQNGARWAVKVASNSESYYFICNDGTLWSIGGNAVGTIGNGLTMNLAGTNWFYNQGQNNLNQDTIYNIAPGTTNWTAVYGTPSNCWYTYANNAQGQLYAWGNNKGGETWNGILDPNFNSGQIHADYPNSWCVPWPTLITWPGTTIVDKITTSPYCVLNPSGSPCNTYTLPTAAAPTVSGTNITASGTTANIAVTATAAGGYYINSTTCSFVSGPVKPVIQFPSSQTTLVTGLTANGVYTFKDSTQDNNLRTATTTFTITVGAVAQTLFYLARSGTGTACSISVPCAPSYLPTLIPTLVAGDIVYLARGGTYPAASYTVSGSSGSHIVFTPYGTGAAPIMGGNTAPTFTGIGSNLYTATYSGVLPPAFLLWNGVIAPRSHSALMTYTPASSTTTSLYVGSNASLCSVGTKVVVWSSSYTCDTATVTAVTSTTITLSPALTYMNPSGDVATGWMILNGTPTSPGQWSYSSGVITFYNTAAPTGVTYPSNDTVAYVSGSYIDFDSLTFTGGNTALVYSAFQTAGGPTLNNCILTGAFDGFFSRGASYVTMNNTVIEQCTDEAVFKEDVSYHWNITNPTWKYIGMNPGMGGSGGGGRYSGINLVLGDTAINITGLLEDSIGYCGVQITGSGSSVTNSIIGHCLQLKGDGAGVYEWTSSSTPYPDSLVISGNYASGLAGPLTLAATPGSATVNCAYYLDAYSNHTAVRNNTADSSGTALYDHGPNNSFLNNTVHYAINNGFWAQQQSGGATITGLVVTGNIIYGASSGSNLMAVQTGGTNQATFGTINNNYFDHSANATPFLMISSSGTSSVNLAAWTTALGYDAASTFILQPLTFNGNPTPSPANITLGLSTDLKGTHYQGSVTIPARSSLLTYLLSCGCLQLNKNISIK